MNDFFFIQVLHSVQGKLKWNPDRFGFEFELGQLFRTNTTSGSGFRC
jgi:hypothetical protein